MDSESGQATVEYLVIGIVLMIVILGLSSLMHFYRDGKAQERTQAGLSHTFEQTEGGAARDILLF